MIDDIYISSRIWSVVWLIITLYYSLYVCIDWISQGLFGLTLLTLSGLITNTYFSIILNLLILLIDVILKGLIVYGFIPTIDGLDTHILSYIRMGDWHDHIAVYLVCHLLVWINLYKSKPSQLLINNPVMYQILSIINYINPIIIYALGLSMQIPQQNENIKYNSIFQQITIIKFQRCCWILLACLLLQFNYKYIRIRKIILTIIILIIIYDYNSFNSSMLNHALILYFKFHLIISNKFINLYLNCNENNDNESQNSNSNSQYILRKNINLRNKQSKYKIILIIILTIIISIFTNTLGNIFLIIAVALTLPSHSQTQFRILIGLGCTIGLILQPYEILYLLLIFILSCIEISDCTFSKHSNWLLIQISRIYVLLCNVSMINLLVGFSQNKWVIVFSLVFLNFCSYFKIILVFMGTNQSYEPSIIGTTTLSSMILQITLWLFLILLSLYNAKTTNTFTMDITNIFQQYWIIKKYQQILHILRFLHWISYIYISLLLLLSQPNLFTLISMILLGCIMMVDIICQNNEFYLKILWNCTLYSSLIMAFIKYFYQLHQYDNLSFWLQWLLQPLILHYQLIGLFNSTQQTAIILLPNITIIILSRIMIYVQSIKIYELYRSQLILMQNIPISQNTQTYSLHYLYSKYIRPIKLQFKSNSTLTIILQHFLFDLYFLILLLIIIIVHPLTHHLLLLPHFLICIVGFTNTVQTYHFTNPKISLVFKMSIAYTCFSVVYLYLDQVWQVIQDKSKNNNLLWQVLVKYIILGITLLFQKCYIALQPLKQFLNFNDKHLMIIWLQPKTKQTQYHQQILLLCMLSCKIGFISIFIATIFNHYVLSVAIHIVIALFMIVLWRFPNKFGFKDSQQITNVKIAYIIGAVALIDIWIGDYICYICFLFTRAYLILFKHYSQHYMNKINSQNKLQYQQLCCKYGECSSKLSIINELESIEDNSMYQSQWQNKNIYLTFIWICPVFTVLIAWFGAILLNPQYLFVLLIILALVRLYLILSNIYQAKKYILICRILNYIFTLISLISGIIYLVSKNNFNNNIHNNDRCGLGIFLLLFCWMFEQKILSPSWNILISFETNFIKYRYEQSILYWQQKSQIISQLGSEIHNQKKLLKLQKYYVEKESLSQRVSTMTKKLTGNSQEEKYWQLERMDNLIAYRSENNSYQLSSNLLTFLDKNLLMKNYKLLNEYCQHEDNNFFTEVYKIKKYVLANYHGSIECTLLKYYKQQQQQQAQNNNNQSKDQSQLAQKTIINKLNEGQKQRQNEDQKERQNEDQKERQSEYQKQRESEDEKQIQSEDQKLNIEKIQEMMQQIQKCLQNLHQTGSMFNWFVKKCIENCQIIGLIIIVGWNFFGGVYTIPANIAIFSWAIILQAKTTKSFWSFLLFYASIIMILKNICVYYFPQNNLVTFIFYYYPKLYLYQYLIVLVCSIEIILIEMGGTARKSYSERQSIYDAIFRLALNKSYHRIHQQNQTTFIDIYSILSTPEKHSFIYRVFSKNKLKPGKDFYPLLSTVQLIILLYIFLFYDLMQFQSLNNHKSLGQLLTLKHLSKNMIYALLFQVIIMIIDRMIVSLNLVDLDNRLLQNFLLNFAFEQQIKYNPPSSNPTYIGIFDLLLIIKYIFHTILLIFINFLVYFYIPSAGFSKTILSSCTNDICGKSYTFLSIFLLLYLIYFLISGLQIKHGFNRNKCRNTLMQKYHYFYYYLYICFTAIPFLWQFKKICDWTITSTALPLFHWMKFQDINAILYRSKCESEMLKIKPKGTPYNKYILGPLGCLIILALVFSPLFVYSILNPFAVQDSIVGASIKIILLMDNKIQYKFFQTSHTIINSEIKQNLTQKWINIERQNIYLLEMSQFPDQTFLLSTPTVNKLTNRIQRCFKRIKIRPFEIILKVTIIEKQAGQSEIQWSRKKLSDEELKLLWLMLIQQENNFIVKSFYSPFPGKLEEYSIKLSTKNEGDYYQLSNYYQSKEQDTIGNNSNNSNSNNSNSNSSNSNNSTIRNSQNIFFFFKSSIKYNIGLGLITFYLTYVLLASRLFRFYLTTNLQNIIYQGYQLQRILILCDAIRSARILENFFQEQYLYSMLIDLMRTTKKFKQITNDFVPLRKNALN